MRGSKTGLLGQPAGARPPRTARHSRQTDCQPAPRVVVPADKRKQLPNSSGFRRPATRCRWLYQSCLMLFGMPRGWGQSRQSPRRFWHCRTRFHERRDRRGKAFNTLGASLPNFAMRVFWMGPKTTALDPGLPCTEGSSGGCHLLRENPWLPCLREAKNRVLCKETFLGALAAGTGPDSRLRFKISELTARPGNSGQSAGSLLPESIRF